MSLVPGSFLRARGLQQSGGRASMLHMGWEMSCHTVRFLRLFARFSWGWEMAVSSELLLRPSAGDDGRNIDPMFPFPPDIFSIFCTFLLFQFICQSILVPFACLLSFCTLFCLDKSLLWQAGYCIVMDRLTGKHGYMNVSIFRLFNSPRLTARSLHLQDRCLSTASGC